MRESDENVESEIERSIFNIADKSWKRNIVHLSGRMRDFLLPDELVYLYPDGVNQCSFSFIMCMPCLLYTSPSPRDRTRSRMPSSA